METVSRSLEIIKNQGKALAEIKSIPEALRTKLGTLAQSLTAEMIGELSINNAAQMPALIGLMSDGNRIWQSKAPAAKNISNRLGQFSRGLQGIWSRVSPEGLAILLDICATVDQIADELAGAD
jgi:hypothetical protein